MKRITDTFAVFQVMTHSTICSEPIYCEDSFMNNKQKSRLLNILNDHRNRRVEKSCSSEKSSALQLVRINIEMILNKILSIVNCF